MPPSFSSLPQGGSARFSECRHLGILGRPSRGVPAGRYWVEVALLIGIDAFIASGAEAVNSWFVRPLAAHPPHRPGTNSNRSPWVGALPSCRQCSEEERPEEVHLAWGAGLNPAQRRVHKSMTPQETSRWCHWSASATCCSSSSTDWKVCANMATCSPSTATIVIGTTAGRPSVPAKVLSSSW